MKKIERFLLPSIFCAFLFANSLVLLLSADKEYSEREKRYLASREEISLSGLTDGKTQKSLERWIEDQFPLRDAYVGIHAYWDLLCGKNALQGIYYAKNDYLITAPNASDTSQFKINASRIDQFAANCEVPVSMVLIPTTGNIKQSILPYLAKNYLDDECYAVMDELVHVRMLDVRQTLLDADLEQPVCYRTDHHLTSWGNYSIYRQWCEENRLAARECDASEINTISDFRGTTWSGSGYWLTPADQIELWDNGAECSVVITDGGQEPIVSEGVFFTDHFEGLDKYPVFLDGNHSLVEISNPNSDGGKILLIKDSYAHGLVPFLTEHYETVIMIDLRFYRGSITDFIQENDVDEVLFYYGVSTLLTDTNSAWLF